MGAAALLVASRLPARPLAQPHRARPRVGGRVQEAGIPIVFHVGGTGDLIDPNYFDNGLPIPPDFHGGEENFRSVDYMGIPGPPAQTLATMIFDGVLERFPDLRDRRDRAGRDLGAVVDAPDGVGVRGVRPARGAAARLSLRPSEYVRRQIRFTPYPTEDVGWIIDQAGPEVVPVLVRLPARRGRPPPDRALRGVARRRVRRRSARRSTATTSST